MKKKKLLPVLGVLAFCMCSFASCDALSEFLGDISADLDSTISAPMETGYSIVFVANGTENEVKFYDDRAEVPNVDTTGKRLVGWSATEDGEVIVSRTDNLLFSYVEDYFGDSKQLKLYAVFSNALEVVFELADAPVSDFLQEDPLNEAKAVDTDLEDFVFLGWSTNPDAKIPQFEDGTAITYETVKTYAQDSKVSLYPVYEYSLTAKIDLYEYFTPDILPEIRIATEGGKAIDHSSLIIPDEHKGLSGELAVYDYIGATIDVTNTGSTETELTDVAAEVKVRGNYTSTYPKRPIRIKFSKKQPMLGLDDGEKAKSWVLLAEWKDPSLLRNSVADYLGKALLESAGSYTTDFRFVKVYLNDSYNGVYLLVDQQQINGSRVDIPESEEETDGVDFGYFLEYDGYYFNEPAIQTFEMDYKGVSAGTRGITVKNDIMNEAQRAFIDKALQTIWDVIYDAVKRPHADLTTQPYHTMDANGNYVKDASIKTAKEAVGKVVDLNTLVNMYIISEICEDSDIGWSSFNFSIDMSATGNRKLTFTAPWDFDYALGNNVAGNAMKPSIANWDQMIQDGRLIDGGGWYYFAPDAVLTDADFTFSNDEVLFAKNGNNPWMSICTNQGWFWEMVSARWNQAKTEGVFKGVETMINTMSEKYVDEFAENFTKWSQAMGNKIDGNQSDITKYFRNQKQAAAYLRAWVNARVAGLDKAIQKETASYQS